MKRIAAIFFITLLAFNVAGYHALFSWLQEKQSIAFTQKFDRGIDEASLISVKAPLTLPYYTNSKDFQWTDGEVMIGGVLYQYVQRRIWNDSIEFRCIKNEGKTNLLSARDKFFSLAYELQSGKEKPVGTTQFKPLFLEYCAFYKPCISAQIIQATSVHFITSGSSTVPTSQAVAKPEQPPERV